MHYLIKNNLLVLYLCFFIAVNLLPQTDWVRWEKSDPSYQIKKENIERENNFEIASLSDLITKPLINTYRFLISDVDGANCPFYPSCSQFFLKAVEETNLVQGTVMFFDRFTRDTNVFDRGDHYPIYDSRHYFDPVYQYKLQQGEIKIFPTKTFVHN